MSCNDSNIYQTVREAAGLTQEVAAERLCISVESLRAYEGRRRRPPDHVVWGMADIYSDKLLLYNHYQQTMERFEELLPDIKVVDLTAAVLRIQKEVNDVLRCRERLIEIACDGIIDETERPEFDGILQELADLQGAILTLKYAKEGDHGNRENDTATDRAAAKRVSAAQAHCCCVGL